jgi:hypothetical protein
MYGGDIVKPLGIFKRRKGKPQSLQAFGSWEKQPTKCSILGASVLN